MHFYLFFILISFSSFVLQASIYLNPLDSAAELKYLPKIQPQIVIKACKNSDRWPVIAWFRADSFCELFNCSLFAFKQKHPNSLTQEREDELFHLCIARDLVDAINYLHINSTQEKMLVLMEASSPQVLRLKINETFLTLMKSLLFVLNKRANDANLATVYATQFMESAMNLQDYQLVADFLVAVANDAQLLPEEERLCFLEKYLNSDFLFFDTWGLYAIYFILVKQACDKEASNKIRNIALCCYEAFLNQMCIKYDFSQYQNLTDEFLVDLIQPFFAFSRLENTMRTSVLSQEERLFLTEKLLNSLKRVGLPDPHEPDELIVDLNAIAHSDNIKECMDLLEEERVYVENNAQQYGAILKNGLKNIAAKKSKVRRLEWEPLEPAAKKRKM